MPSVIVRTPGSPGERIPGPGLTGVTLFEINLYSFLSQPGNSYSSALETKPGLQHRAAGFYPMSLAGNHTVFLVLLPLLWKPVPQDYALTEKELGGDLGRGDVQQSIALDP